MIKEPIMCFEGYDLSLFETIEQLESWLEPWNMDDEDVYAFDSTGKKLKLIVQKYGKSIHSKKYILHSIDENEECIEELKDKLYKHLNRKCKVDDSLIENKQIIELIELAVDHHYKSMKWWQKRIKKKAGWKY